MSFRTEEAVEDRWSVMPFRMPSTHAGPGRPLPPAGNKEREEEQFPLELFD